MSDPGRGVCAAPTADRTVTGKVEAAVGVRRPRRRRYEGPMRPNRTAGSTLNFGSPGTMSGLVEMVEVDADRQNAKPQVGVEQAPHVTLDPTVS